MTTIWLLVIAGISSYSAPAVGVTFPDAASCWATANAIRSTSLARTSEPGPHIQMLDAICVPVKQEGRS